MKNTREIRAVLFDMDGLLFDSEIVGQQVFQETGREQGVEIRTDHFRLTLGATLEEARKIYQTYYPQLDYDELRREVAVRMLKKAEDGKILLKKGARALLEVLKEKHIPMAVASSSREKIIVTYLEKAGIRDYFDLIQTGVELKNSKPHPDIFWTAAEKLGVDIRDCMVLEDSLNGIRAGRASGALTIMIPDLIPYEEKYKEYVDAVLPDLSAVIPYFD